MKTSIFADEGYPNILLFTENRKYICVYHAQDVFCVEGGFDPQRVAWARLVIYL